MRVQPWLATILSTFLAAFCCDKGVAQEFSDSGGATTSKYSSIPDSEIGSSLYARDYTGQEAGMGGQQTGFMQQQFPQGAGAWPGTNLYNNQFEQIYQENGLWHRMINNEGKKYFFTMEALMARTSRLGNIRIGNTEVTPIEDPSFNFFPGGLAPPMGGLDGNGVNHFFPTQSTDGLRRNAQYGLRGRWGFDNSDGSGFELIGWYLPEDTFAIDLGDDNHPSLTNVEGSEPLATIPVDDGLAGDLLLFDDTFKFSQTGQSYGASASFRTTPVFKRGAFKLRPSFGARYMHIRQGFYMEGTGSGVTGISYAFTNGVFTGATGTTPTQAAPPYTTYIDSKSRSELAGPEAGLVYELGGESIRFIGKTLVGVMANHETIDINGDGFVQPFAPGLPIPFTPTNPNPHQFAEKEVTNHVSPLFEQSISVESRVFQFVPIIKRSRFFNQAMLRAGYTIIIAGEIANPAASINYRSEDPTFVSLGRHPEIAPKRRQWSTQMWNVGVTWTY